MGRNRRYQTWVTFSLILANVVVFMTTVDENLQLREEIAFQNGFVPSLFFHGRHLPSILTHMFLHAEVTHLLSNMFALLWIGISLESRIGWRRFLAVYLASGFLAALVFGALDPTSARPAVGASACIFGLMGNLVLLYPGSLVFILVIPVPVMLIAIFYAFTTIAFIQRGDVGPVGHVAHLAGMVSGMFLAFLMSPEDALKGLSIFILCFLAIVVMIQLL